MLLHLWSPKVLQPCEERNISEVMDDRKLLCLPSFWISGWSHLNRQEAYVQTCEFLECCLSEIDVPGALRASRTRVDHAHKYTLLRAVAHWNRTSSIDLGKAEWVGENIRSRNLKHFGRVVQPSRVRAQAKELSFWCG